MVPILFVIAVVLGPTSVAVSCDFITQLESKDAAIRLNAAKELAKLGKKLPPQAVDPLLKALDDPDFNVRAEAMDAIKNSGVKSDNTIAALIKIVETELDQAASYHAEVALARIGKPAVQPIIETIRRGKMRNLVIMYGILGDIGPDARPAIPLLEGVLGNKDLDVRLLAARMIVEIDGRNKAVESVLTAALRDKEQRVRLLAAKSMARSSFLKTKEVRTVLLDILRDGKAPLERNFAAAMALARFESDGFDALPSLTQEFETFKDLFPPLAVCIAGAIVKIDAKSKTAREYLESKLDLLREMAQPENDRTFAEFATDLLENVLQKKSNKDR